MKIKSQAHNFINKMVDGIRCSTVSYHSSTWDTCGNSHVPVSATKQNIFFAATTKAWKKISSSEGIEWLYIYITSCTNLMVFVSLMDLVWAMALLLPTVMEALMPMKNTSKIMATRPIMGPTRAHTTLS